MFAKALVHSRGVGFAGGSLPVALPGLTLMAAGMGGVGSCASVLGN